MYHQRDISMSQDISGMQNSLQLIIERANAEKSQFKYIHGQTMSLEKFNAMYELLKIRN